MAAGGEKHAVPGFVAKRRFGCGSCVENASFVGVGLVDVASSVVAASFVGADAA